MQDSNIAPHAKDALTKAQIQQQEAQLALQRAQHDIMKAQEQARQAAAIQEQTKRAQAQEAQSAAALAQAQETARQAAIIKEQAENALRAAQAGIVQPAPPMNIRATPSPQNIPQSLTNGAPMNMTSQPMASGPPMNMGGFPPSRPSMPSHFNAGIPTSQSFGGNSASVSMGMPMSMGGAMPGVMPSQPPPGPRILPPPLIPMSASATGPSFVPVGGVSRPPIGQQQSSMGNYQNIRPGQFGGNMSMNQSQQNVPVSQGDTIGIWDLQV